MEKINCGKLGYKRDDFQVDCLAFADNLVIVSLMEVAIQTLEHW